MYDYEYEGDVLDTLRVLKYFQMTRPERFQSQCKCYKTLGLETMEDLVWESAWELFDDAENNFEEDYEVETYIVEDKLLDKYWSIIKKRARNGGSFSEMACRELFQDTLCYFLTASGYTIARIDCFLNRDSVMVKLWMSPDTWEPIRFANDIVTLMLYLTDACAGKNKKGKNQRKEAA